MPEPLLYLQAMAAAAIVSAIAVLAMAGTRRMIAAVLLEVPVVVGCGLGLAVGYYVLALNLAWPPSSALDRFMTIVLPALLAIEFIAVWQQVPRWLAWLLRMALAFSLPRILLHGSVYLTGDDWTSWQAASVMLIGGFILAATWDLLARLQQRGPGVSIPLALALATQTAGLLIMLAGYIKGGAAAIPLAAGLVATALAARLVVTGPAKSADADERSPMAAAALIGIGVVGLFGVLFVGRYFGRLSTPAALIVFLTPLLCWVTEVPLLRDRQKWLVGTLRILLVAAPLLVLLIIAKGKFDREMAPLLGTRRRYQDGPSTPFAHVNANPPSGLHHESPTLLIEGRMSHASASRNVHH